jgi:predicted nucleotidyltransferase
MIDAIADELRRLIVAVPGLERQLGVRACIIGGVARNIWAEPRATQDVDIIVDAADANAVLPAAAAVGLVYVDKEVDALAKSAMTRLRLPEELAGEIRLDVIARSHEFYGRVLDRSVVIDALGVQLRVASVEDVIVLKTLADRSVDRGDIAAMIAAASAGLDRELIRRECTALEIDVPPGL